MTVYDKYAPHVEGSVEGAKWLESNELELKVREAKAPAANSAKEPFETLGWRDDYQRGLKFVDELLGLSPDDLKKAAFNAYRGMKVAFEAWGAPPGGTNDLVTKDGFYIRVVAKQNKDLRPTFAGSEVAIRGEILQVFTENKIIVLEVDEKDWKDR